MHIFSRYPLLLLSCLLLFASAAAQKEDNTWTFGYRLGLDFNQNPPAFFQTNMMTSEGCSSVSDGAGNLLFYSNGNDVWDASNNVMPNGSGILGNGLAGGNIPGSTSQGVAIIRSVSNPMQYFLFTLDAEEQISAGLTPGYLRYSVIDMSLNGGLGDVLPARKNIILDSLMSEQMDVARGQDCSYWLITHRRHTTLYRTFKIDINGVNPVPVNSSGVVPGQPAGQLKLSPDGHLLAWATETTKPIELATFDNATGIVSSAVVMDTSTALFLFHYGVAFSPDSKRLYCTGFSQVIQYDVSLWPDITAIRASKYLAVNSPTFNYSHLGMREAPDNKIYMVKVDIQNPANPAYLASIDNPNALGAACAYNATALQVPPGMILPAYFGRYGYSLGNRFFINRSGDTLIRPARDTVACFAGTVRLSAPEYDEYTWSNGAIGRSINVNESGTYWVAGFKDCHTYIDTIHLNLVGFDLALGNDTAICPGDPLFLDATVPGASYQWQDGSHDPVYRVTQGGMYRVTINKEGCSRSDSIRITLMEPYLDIMEKDTIICSGTAIDLHAKAFPESSYLWNTGNATSAVTVIQAGIYEVTATNVCGNFSDSVRVDLENCACPVFAPNVFSPNGDGTNDQFSVKVSCRVSSFRLDIYNRYGERVFHTEDPQGGWDGQYKGRLSDTGTYFYYLKYTGPDNTRFEKKGDLILLR